MEIININTKNKIKTAYFTTTFLRKKITFIHNKILYMAEF